MCLSELLQAAGNILLIDFLRYFLAAGLAFLLLWKWLGPRVRHRRIDPAYPGAAELRREFGYSLLTVLIFATNGVLIYFLAQQGTLEIYADARQYGWAYWFASLVGLTLWHDAYFYFTHRLLHHPRLFRRVHAVHHRSRNPSPWAAYAFHPLEAVVQAAFLPLFLLVAPLHWAVIVLFLLYMIVRNVLGHSGVEIYPCGAYDRRPWRWVTSTTHHHLHHQAARGNYGLYFTWWDRWLGTEQAGYRETLQRLTAQRLLATSPSKEQPT